MMWLKRLFSRRRLYGDLSDEIREHLEEKLEELVASGLPRKEAAAAARREFGNVTFIEESSREVWRWPSIESFLVDMRNGLRMLRRNPGFSAVAILTLGLGIPFDCLGYRDFDCHLRGRCHYSCAACHACRSDGRTKV
jgi:hypothetical protein